MNVRPAKLPKRSAIFINYRRQDSAGHTGRLFDNLSARFPGRVFMDIDTIQPGIDFVEAIEQALGCCEVLLVMIGDQWLSLNDASGNRRLDNASDFVRLEIAEALERNIRVIPVLVEGASIPRPDDLPPELAKLTRRNAIELSDARWAFDVERLIQAIEGVLVEKAPSAILVKVPSEPASLPPAPVQEEAREEVRERGRSRAALVIALLVLAAVGIGWALGNHMMSLPKQLSFGKPAPTSPVPTSSTQASLAPEKLASEKVEQKTGPKPAADLKKTATGKKAEKKVTAKPKPAPAPAEGAKAEAGKGQGKGWKERGKDWFDKIRGKKQKGGEQSAPAQASSSSK